MPAIFGAESTTLGLLRSFAERGDKVSEALVAIMNGTNWVSLSAGPEASNIRRVTGQVKDQDGQDVAAATNLRVRVVPPLKAFLADVYVATAAPLPSCTPAGTGVGHTLTGDVNGALSVDGVAVVVGQRILVRNQASASNNGVYTVTAAGSGGAAFVLTRATDFDAALELAHGVQIRSLHGDATIGKIWVHTTGGVITVDTTAITFVELDSGNVGGQTIGTKGTLNSGIGSRDVWITTDATGAFEVDVTSLLVGNHLVEAVTDNGETEQLVAAFA